MAEKLEDILPQCVEDIKAGRSTIKDCTDKYPSLRNELEPLLRVALEIQQPRDVRPSPAFKVRARVQLMEHIHAGQSVTEGSFFRYLRRLRQIQFKRRFDMVGIILAVVLAVTAGGGGAAYASEGSLPGDALYPVKLLTEEVRYAVTPGDLSEAELDLAFADRRVEEIAALAEEGRSEQVDTAVNGYESAIARALERVETAGDKDIDIADLSELLAETTLQHLSRLDEVMTIAAVPGEARAGLENARQVSMNGYGHALERLAQVNAERAMEINLAAMERSLNRAKARAGENDFEGIDVAVDEFLALNEFGEEISGIAQELAEDPTRLQELVAQATSVHLEVLDHLATIVPEEAQGAIKQAREESQKGHERAVEALKEAGVEDIPGAPSTPPGSAEDVGKPADVGLPGDDDAGAGPPDDAGDAGPPGGTDDGGSPGDDAGDAGPPVDR